MAARATNRCGRVLVAAVAGVALIALIAPALPAGAAPGHDIVLNGGFEQQRSNGVRPRHWSAKGAANDFTGSAHSGSYNLDLVVGDPLPNVASVSQTVTIPAGSTRAALTFWTEDWSCGTTIHFAAHVITGAHDTVVKTIPGTSCGTGYVKSSVSLKRFRGRTVTLRFSTTWTAGGGGSLFYLDDVSLLVS